MIVDFVKNLRCAGQKETRLSARFLIFCLEHFVQGLDYVVGVFKAD